MLYEMIGHFALGVTIFFAGAYVAQKDIRLSLLSLVAFAVVFVVAMSRPDPEPSDFSKHACETVCSEHGMGPYLRQENDDWVCYCDPMAGRE